MSALLTPQQYRERLVASYLGSYRRMYGEVDERAVERQVLADIELVEGARRAGDLRDAPRRDPADRPASVRPDLLAAAQAETNTKLSKPRDPRDAVPYRPGVTHGNPMLVSARWGAAVARIGRILQGAGRAATFSGAVANAEIPELARRYAELWSFYTTRSAPPRSRGRDHNPFRELSDQDAARMFMRKCEDICDASTGVLGWWYVR